MIFKFLKGVKNLLIAVKHLFDRFLETKFSRKIASTIFFLLGIVSMIVNLSNMNLGWLNFLFLQTAIIVYLILYALALLKFSLSWHIEDTAKFTFRVIGAIIFIIALLPIAVNIGLLGFLPVALDLSLTAVNSISLSLLLAISALFGFNE